MSNRISSAAMTGFGLLLSITLAQVSQAADSYHWIQYSSQGLELRVIREAGACPAASVNKQAVNMTQRAAPGEDYPITVCSLLLPKQLTSVEVDGMSMPLPKPHPTRILVLGDTGCRLKGKKIQDCHDPVAWPFQVGSQKTAKLQPDLILHVGDFHYRNTPCPAGNTVCTGSPHGDNWAVWKDDFFSPVGNLLATAPWIMTRGNHEECELGGRGWARTLDPYPWQSDLGCMGPAQPYLVDLGDITLAVMDVSTAEEDKVDGKQAEHFRQQYAALASIGRPVWIAQHRPIWAAEETNGPEITGDNKTLEAAARSGMPANVQTILSGHHHAFEALSYEESLPVQWIMGNSGDELSLKVPVYSDGMAVSGVHVKVGRAVVGIFGYSMLEHAANAAADQWTVNSFDYDGKLLQHCELKARSISCKKPE